MPFYDNFDKYLRNEITTDGLILKKRIALDYDEIVRWWRNKSKKRYISLYENEKLKPEKLTYYKLPYMTWEDVKNDFFSEVGR